MRDKQGNVHLCGAKSEVFALRFNKRTIPMINQVQKGRSLTLDQQISAAVADGLRKTVCNVKGVFLFDRLEPGFWYVWTQIDPPATTAVNLVASFVIVPEKPSTDIELFSEGIVLWPADQKTP